MKSKLTAFFIFTVLLLSSLSVTADVFTLGPARGGKPWGADLMGGAKLWTEHMKINGLKIAMRLALIDRPLAECIKIFHGKFPDAVFRGNGESCLVEIKRKNGMRERIYLVDVGGDVFPVLQFSMELPAKLPEKPDWPAELPIPGSATPLKVIRMLDRGTLYGTFTTSMRPNLLYNDMDMKLSAEGWHTLGKGVFLKDTPMQMIMVSASEDENGVVHCSVVKRKLGE